MTTAITGSYSAWSDLAVNMLRTQSTCTLQRDFNDTPSVRHFVSTYLEGLYVLRSNYTPETKDAIANRMHIFLKHIFLCIFWILYVVKAYFKRAG